MRIKKLLRWFYYRATRLVSARWLMPCRNFVFEVTYHCNLDCRMCCYLQEIRLKKDEIAPRKEMDSREIMAIIKQIPFRSNLAFTGGEPFTKKGFMDILACAKQRGHAVTIGTNGVLLTKEICEKLVDLKIEQICFSLDGPREIHNAIRQREIAFDGVTRAIADLKKTRESRKARYPRIMVNAVIQPENLRHLPETVRIMHVSGADTACMEAIDGSLERSASRLQDALPLSISPLDKVPEIDAQLLREALEHSLDTAKKIGIPLGFSPDGMDVDELIRYYRHEITAAEWHCSIPYETCRISPYGDLFPCMNYRIGSVREHSLYALWASKRYASFRRLFKKEHIRPFCVGCCKMVKTIAQ
ncbi:MAG: radical SAM protein [Chitinivibrionales bacterium]|nr:radical SAM protein [Chitinivibrionales bacterium]